MTTVDWVAAPQPAGAAILVAAGCSPFLAPLLARRGVADGEAARRFLAPSLDQLHDPRLLVGMEEAVARRITACSGTFTSPTAQPLQPLAHFRVAASPTAVTRPRSTPRSAGTITGSRTRRGSASSGQRK